MIQAESSAASSPPPGGAPRGGHRASGRVGAPSGSAVAVVGLFVMAALYVAHLGQALLIPLVLAAFLAVILAPAVRGLRGWLRLPQPLGAALVVLALGAALIYGVYRLSGPAAMWLETAPGSLREIEARIDTFRQTVEELSEATSRVEEMAEVEGARRPPVVEIQQQSLGEFLFAQTWRAVAGTALVLVLLYFLLASGRRFFRKLVRVIPGLRGKKRAVGIVRQIESDVSRYLLTVTLINAALGAAVGVSLALAGMPNPALWGTMAGILNFVPYLGSGVGIVIVTAVAILSFDRLSYALAVPVIYLVLTSLEGYLLTPYILGRRLMLNPVIILLGVVFWGWIWGPGGALLAVPMLVVFKVVCAHLPSLRPISEFLGA